MPGPGKPFEKGDQRINRLGRPPEPAPATSLRKAFSSDREWVREQLKRIGEQEENHTAALQAVQLVAAYADGVPKAATEEEPEEERPALAAVSNDELEGKVSSG